MDNRRKEKPAMPGTHSGPRRDKSLPKDVVADNNTPTSPKTQIQESEFRPVQAWLDPGQSPPISPAPPELCPALLMAMDIRPMLSRTALEVYRALLELGPHAFQNDLVARTGVSRQAVSRALRELQTEGLIVVDRHHDRGKTKNSYRFAQLPGSDVKAALHHPAGEGADNALQASGDVKERLHRPPTDVKETLHHPAGDVNEALHDPGSDVKETLHDPTSDVKAALQHPPADVKAALPQPPESGPKRAKKGQKGAMSSQLYPMNHDDDHDHVKKHEKHHEEAEKTGLTTEKEQIWDLLDLYEATEARWIDRGELKKRIAQPHCTVEFARAWREWWLAAMVRRHNYTNPAGFVNNQMRLGRPPPSLPSHQFDLPADSLDMAELQRRQAQMEENPPVEGATFDAVTGMWH